MVLNQDDYVNDIQDDVYIQLQMDNLDIREFYQLEYVLDDVPNNLPIEKKVQFDWKFFLKEFTLTLEINEHCRHRWTFALLGGVDFSLLFVWLLINSDDLVEVDVGIGGIGSCSDVNLVKVFGECVRLCSSRPEDESQ